MVDAAETDYAWAAGFIDGEGSIMITHNDGPTRKNTNYQLRMAVPNSDRQSVEEIFRIFSVGGIISTKTTKGHKLSHVWQLAGNRSISAILEKVLPYLRVKRERALLALEFVKLPKSTGGRTVKKEWMDERKNYYERMRKLNE